MLPRYEVSMTESREKCWDLEYIRLIYLFIYLFICLFIYIDIYIYMIYYI